MNFLPTFFDQYFAFLLSGSAMDFHEAHGTMVAALASGASWDAVQQCMDSSHESAELLTVFTDAVDGFDQEVPRG